MAGVAKGAAKKVGKKGAKKSVKKIVKNKAPPTPHQIEKRKFERAIREIFRRVDFERVKSDGKEFTFRGRTGELDDIFLYENIIVVAEYTVGQPSSEHVSKKNLLWDLIRAHRDEWVEFLCKKFPAFQSHFDAHSYLESEYRLCVCYFSKASISQELENLISHTRFLDHTKIRYFDALSKAIHRSARFEFFKFMGIEFSEVGQEIKKTSNTTKEFKGHLLPDGFSSFPKGFKVASFYADPNTLLSMSYVLRRDSWRDPEGMYQRVLMKGRMNEMRRYLTTEERVFVNNIIVTLPNETKLNELGDSGKNIPEHETKTVRAVTVAVPHRSNVIGIIDGQHRVFCYHEGTDAYEQKIKKLRERQNLLVTGIIYPANYTGLQRQRFEAKLFLEINDKQRKARSDLKQSIELILNPYSNTAIAKRIVERLNAAGPLKGMLQTNYFDPPSLIRTTSIVAYGLRPLIKVGTKDSMYAVWPDARKSDIAEKLPGPGADEVLTAYIDFCVTSINALLIAAKKQIPGKWRLSEKAKDRELTPTLINGLFVCLRLLITHKKKLYSQVTYEARLKDLGTFDFKRHRSSRWGALGAALYTGYFEDS